MPKRNFSPHHILFASICVSLAAFALDSAAQQIDLAPPPEGEYVLDYAGLIDPEDEQEINEIAAASLAEKAIPIVTVTIESMDQYGGGGMRIETFATLLYNQWEIGHERVNDEYWNKGILLLVARDDRFSRIELGDGWDREHDDVARTIMDDQIIRSFKQGNFSAGVLRGVEALDNMARGEKLPRKPISWRNVAIMAAFIGLAAFTVFSLIRRGASGWAWVFWGVVFGILGMVLLNMMRSSGGSGGFSGGAFGGGFSGGGGATGSW